MDSVQRWNIITTKSEKKQWDPLIRKQATMFSHTILDRFLRNLKGQAMREGTRYAREARVGEFVGTEESLTTVVEGQTGDYEIALWIEEGAIVHRCTCPSWRNPCKHEVAAVLALKQGLSNVSLKEEKEEDSEGMAPPLGGKAGFDEGEVHRLLKRSPDPVETRDRALEERRVAARREKLRVLQAEPPYLEVRSGSDFVYRVHVRGDSNGPHSCTCPDFEANRLHTCKHVERVRIYLRNRRVKLGPAFMKAAKRPRIFLHFGEVVEPRLFGRPSGRGAPQVRAAFDEGGLPLRPLSVDPAKLRRWLQKFGSRVEAEALSWLDHRLKRLPRLPRGPVKKLISRPRMNPYPYQWEGTDFLARRGRALLADEMGLGKTVQAILAAAVLGRARPAVNHVTVVCPASLRGGWKDEIQRWIGQDSILLQGRPGERAEVIASRPRWLITHYEQVLRDHEHHQAAPPDLLIIDEAQRAKGLQARTARVLKAIDTRYVFALTGTPLENRLEEAYAIAQLIDQRLLPPLWQVDRDHFVRDEKGRRVVFYRNLEMLRSNLAPAFLRRRKEDVSLQLPERVRSISMVGMHPAVEATYGDVMFQVAILANKKVILPADLDRMLRLLTIARRCCNGPHMLGMEVDDRKVAKLQELEHSLKDLCFGEGRKAVVFSEWTDMTARVEGLCNRMGLRVFHLFGGVSIKKRPAMIRDFTDCEGPAVFISTDAGGVGLNLQAADVLINLDLPWNPAKLEQRIGRVHRIGSSRTVQIILLVCKESVEEKILLLHDTKRNVFKNIWAKNGDDIIEAPGGSGHFKAMIKALLETHQPEAREEAEKPPVVDVLPVAGDLPINRVPESKEDRTDGRGRNGSGNGMRKKSETGQPSSGPSAVVDPKAVAAAVAAVAPALPADHRQSLATVFRALAEALEG